MSDWIGPNIYRIEAYTNRKAAITNIGNDVVIKYDPSSTPCLTSNNQADARIWSPGMAALLMISTSKMRGLLSMPVQERPEKTNST